MHPLRGWTWCSTLRCRSPVDTQRFHSRGPLRLVNIVRGLELFCSRVVCSSNACKRYAAWSHGLKARLRTPSHALPHKLCDLTAYWLDCTSGKFQYRDFFCIRSSFIMKTRAGCAIFGSAIGCSSGIFTCCGGILLLLLRLRQTEERDGVC